MQSCCFGFEQHRGRWAVFSAAFHHAERAPSEATAKRGHRKSEARASQGCQNSSPRSTHRTTSSAARLYLRSAANILTKGLAFPWPRESISPARSRKRSSVRQKVITVGIPGLKHQDQASQVQPTHY